MHPLISAYLRAEELYSGMTFKSRDRLEALEELGRFEQELMASERVPNLTLGFYNSRNPCAEGYFVWLFNGMFKAELFFPLTKPRE
jgi:hypothetical protein